jgi:L-ascorbate metabolism protein UlaG (beta-lactamase superfamily)
MTTNITWLGHAALAITMGGKKLLVDPYLSENPLAAAKAGEVEADFILVTHGHHDHIGDALAIARRTGAVVIGTPGVARWLKAQGAARTQEQPIGTKAAFPFGGLQVTMAVHDGSLPDGSSGGLPAGFVIASPEGQRLYIAGDTFLPIGGKYTMDPADALQAVKLLRPKAVLPYHYDTWKVIEQNPESWKRDVEVATPAKVVVLKPGGSMEL